MVVRILSLVIALCLVGGAVQAADLSTPDTAAEIDLDRALPDMAVTAPFVVAIVRRLVVADPPATVELSPRLHVTDLFRPPQP